MSQSRTQHEDAPAWTPFDPPDTDTPVVGDADGQTDARPRDGHADVRQVAVHGTDGTSRRWQIIEGGHDSSDGFEAVVDDALGVAADTVEDTPPAPAATAAPAVETVEEAAPEAAPGPVATPVEAPVETGSEPDSALRTPHPDPDTPESENAAHTGTGEAETPHSTPARRALAALNPGGVLFKQQASLAEIVTYARTAPYSTNKAVRALETGWAHAVAVPASLLLYAAAAAYKRLWRGLGTSTIGVLWIIAVHASPVDAATVWTWTLLGYWAVSAFLVPVIVTTRK